MSEFKDMKDRITKIPNGKDWNEERDFQEGFKGFSDTYGIPDSEACHILEDIIANPICKEEGIRKKVFRLFSRFQFRMNGLQDRMKGHSSYQWYRDYTIRTLKEKAETIDQQIRDLNLDEVQENAYFVSNVAHILVTSMTDDDS